MTDKAPHPNPDPPFADVTGVILAGGSSSRMGRDKALLKVEGVPLFERVRRALGGLFAATLIAGDRPDLTRPGLPCYRDRYPGSALGGLYTGLQAATTPYIFVIACDMPYPDRDLIRQVVQHRQGVDAVVPRTAEGLEPLFALYGKACLPPMRRLLESGRFRIYDFYPEVRVRYLEETELSGDRQKALINVNTPEDMRDLVDSD